MRDRARVSLGAWPRETFFFFFRALRSAGGGRSHAERSCQIGRLLSRSLLLSNCGRQILLCFPSFRHNRRLAPAGASLGSGARGCPINDSCPASFPAFGFLLLGWCTARPHWRRSAVLRQSPLEKKIFVPPSGHRRAEQANVLLLRPASARQLAAEFVRGFKGFFHAFSTPFRDDAATAARPNQTPPATPPVIIANLRDIDYWNLGKAHQISSRGDAPRLAPRFVYSSVEKSYAAGLDAGNATVFTS